MKTAPSLFAAAVILGLCFGASATAEVLELEGTIKAIDAEARSVTIVRKTPKGEKVLELEVAKNAGDLAEFRKGDQVSVTYDPTLELISALTMRVSADLLLAAGSEWVSEADRLRLRLISRDGDRYTALFLVGENIIREIKGKISGSKIQWLAKDVTAIKGGPGGDNFGVLTQDGKGPRLDFKWQGSDGKGGEFSLRKAKSTNERRDGSSDPSPVARDMKLLQGEWEAVEAEFGGKPLDRLAVRKLNRLVRIKGNTFHEERLLDGRAVGVDGKFEIDPDTGAFDLIGKATGSEKVFEYVGIYEVDGDTLKLCCRANVDGTAKRPKTFKSDDEKPNWSHYYVYKRLEK